MKKVVLFCSVFLLINFISISSISAESANADDSKVIQKANEVAKEHGLNVEKTDDFKGKRLEFDSVKEFEEFLEKEKAQEEKQAKQAKKVQPLATTNPTYCERNLTGSFCVQATVDRNSSGLILGVENVHSYTSGVEFGITWTELYTDYSYGNRSGSAWAVGEKYYGVTIGGIPAGYTKKHTLTVNF